MWLARTRYMLRVGVETSSFVDALIQRLKSTHEACAEAFR